MGLNLPILNQAYNPGKAKWCDDHRRLECAKHRSKGIPCHAAAIRGTDACAKHGGHTKAVLKAKGEARITAWSAVGEATHHVDAGMAVLGMLQMSWLRAAAYGELLRQQVVKDGTVATEKDYDPENLVKEPSGLIGYKYGAAGKDGTIYAVSEEVRALVELESRERDRVVKFAKTAHEMGISERLTNLAEKWGDLVVTRMMLVLDALNLSPAQESMVPGLMQMHLGQIDVGAINGELVKKP